MVRSARSRLPAPAHRPGPRVRHATATAGLAQTPDLLLVNGTVLTLDGQSSVAQAVAISAWRIAAIGSDDEIRFLAAAGDIETIDLQGRTVIPGLIYSHMHAIRAALSFSTEVNWIGSPSIPEARKLISDTAQHAAPDNPVYVQLFYERALLTPKGMEALGIGSDADLPGGGTLELDAAGQQTGWVIGGMVPLFARLPAPAADEQVEGTRRFFSELNRLGVTGVGDPGGFGMTPEKYTALFRLWQDGELTMRVAYSVMAQQQGTEFADY